MTIFISLHVCKFVLTVIDNYEADGCDGNIIFHISRSIFEVSVFSIHKGTDYQFPLM